MYMEIGILDRDANVLVDPNSFKSEPTELTRDVGGVLISVLGESSLVWSKEPFVVALGGTAFADFGAISSLLY